MKISQDSTIKVNANSSSKEEHDLLGKEKQHRKMLGSYLGIFSFSLFTFSVGFKPCCSAKLFLNTLVCYLSKRTKNVLLPTYHIMIEAVSKEMLTSKIKQPCPTSFQSQVSHNHTSTHLPK